MVNLPSTSGIYIITCTVDGKFYIGGAVNLHKRWGAHRAQLRLGAHINQHLQRAWNKHGEATFTVAILELCERDLLTEREQHYLDTMQPFDPRGFNISHEVKMVITRKGQKLSPEHIAKVSAALKGRKLAPEHVAKTSAANRGRKHTPEARANMGASRKGHPVSEETRAKIRSARIGSSHSEETRAKLSAARKGRKPPPNALTQAIAKNSKAYIVIAPDGTRTRIINLNKFCRENGLHTAAMVAIANGKPHRKSYKGWKCEHDNTEKQERL